MKRKRTGEQRVARPFVWLFAAGGMGALSALLFSWAGLLLVLPIAGYVKPWLRPKWFFWLLAGAAFIGCLRINLHLFWEQGIEKSSRTLTAVVCQIEEAEETVSGDLRIIIRSESFRGKAEAYGVGVEAGQWIRADVRLTPIQNTGNPGEFDRVTYGRVRGIYYEAELSEISVVREGNGPILETWRGMLAQKILQILPQEEGGLLAAILLGEDRYLEKSIEEAFQDVGIAHILAISGLHVGIVYGLLRKALERWISRRRAAVVATWCLWFYVIFTGAAVSTLRAGILSTLSAGQRIEGGRQDPLNSLAGAAAILLLIHPLYLLDIGFQLSFGCVLALHLLQGIPGRAFFLPPTLRKQLAPSVAILILGTPLSLYYFYRVSPYQIFLNLLILPVMSLLFVLGGLVLLLLFVWEEAGAFLAGGVYALLHGICLLVQEVLTWPGAVWTLGRPDMGFLLLYYLGWGLVLFWQNMRRNGIPWLCIGVFSLCLLRVFWPEAGWRCTFLNVGQGDCAVIESGDKTFLIDAGPAYGSALRPYLRSRGITQIDGIWISHFDWDHVEGLFTLLEEAEIRVESWYVPDGPWHQNEKLEELYAWGQRVYLMEAGDRVQAGELTFTCLSPEIGVEYTDGNSASMVIRLEDEHVAILFCGDADLAAEERFVQDAGHCQILKAGHHGSRTSTGDTLLSRVRPELTVISCDRENRYGHPHQETLERIQNAGSQVLVTDDVGAVQILVRDNTWTYVTGKAG